ncbi:MAG: CBS domain-containing protein, partial [Caldilineaceae bacterium]|nr:CBS domain-containing protein [Caldilineaceae bacterium]
ARTNGNGHGTNGHNGNGHVNGHANGNGAAHDWGSLPTADVMNRNVVTTSPHELLSDAINKLINGSADRLVVVEQENGHVKPVGTVLASDLARAV